MFTDSAIVYYLPGTARWGPSFGGAPTGLWNPVIETNGPGFGAGPTGFRFNITGTTNIPIVVESVTNPTNRVWAALESANLTNGSFTFRDPGWINYPAWLYRIRSP